MRTATGIALYGRETWEATDLICNDPAQLPLLAQRVIRTRRFDVEPRVETVSFDASTGDDVVDLLTVADPRIPSRWQVHLRTGGVVFDRQMFVTGVRHVMDRNEWTCRFDLDSAWPFRSARRRRPGGVLPGPRPPIGENGRRHSGRGPCKGVAMTTVPTVADGELISTTVGEHGRRRRQQRRGPQGSRLDQVMIGALQAPQMYVVNTPNGVNALRARLTWTPR